MLYAQYFIFLTPGAQVCGAQKAKAVNQIAVNNNYHCYFSVIDHSFTFTDLIIEMDKIMILSLSAIGWNDSVRKALEKSNDVKYVPAFKYVFASDILLYVR